MSGLWKTTKSYSRGAAELAAAPVTFAGGLVGQGATVTTVTTSTVTTLGSSAAGVSVTTTTVSYASAGFATAAGGVALAAAAGTAVGQLANGAFSFFWDPEPIDTRLSRFTQVANRDVDAFLNRLFRAPAVRSRRAKAITLRDVVQADEIFPGLGSAAARYARQSVRTLVHILRGAALGSAGNRKEVQAAAKVVRRDLDNFLAAMRAFAKLLARDHFISPLNPRISLDSYQDFIEDHRRRGRQALPPIEAQIIAGIGTLAKVSFREDLSDRVARWVAEGPDPGEVAAFQNAQDNMLAFADILLDSLLWCWSDFDLGRSDYLGHLPR